MSRLQCLGRSSPGSQRELAVEVTSDHAETNKPNDKLGKKAITDKPCSNFPAILLPRSVQETQKSGFSSGVLNTDVCSKEESRHIIPRVEEKAQWTAAPDDELKMKYLMKVQLQDSAGTGEPTHASPVEKPLPIHGGNGKEKETEEDDVMEEDLKAPLELMLQFLRAVMDRDLQLASKLCQMILIYEPDNPEASEFLPLIHKKLLKDDDDDSDDDDDDEGDTSSSDEDSYQHSSRSSSSCSSSSPSDDQEKEEKPVNRDKPCLPSHICPKSV